MMMIGELEQPIHVKASLQFLTWQKIADAAHSESGRLYARYRSLEASCVKIRDNTVGTEINKHAFLIVREPPPPLMQAQYS